LWNNSPLNQTLKTRSKRDKNKNRTLSQTAWYMKKLSLAQSKVQTFVSNSIANFANTPSHLFCKNFVHQREANFLLFTPGCGAYFMNFDQLRAGGEERIASASLSKLGMLPPLAAGDEC